MAFLKSTARSAIVVALFVWAVGESASAGTCRDILSKVFAPFKNKMDRRQNQIDEYDLGFALKIYEAARREDDVFMGAIGLMQAASVVLRHNKSFRQDIIAFNDVKLPLVRYGASQSDASSTVRSEYVRLHSGYRAWLRALPAEYLKTLLPTAVFPLWRLIHSKSYSSVSIKFPLSVLIETDLLPLKQDDFLQRALAAAWILQDDHSSRSLQKTRSRVTRNKSLKPLAVSFTLWLLNLHPMMVANSLLSPSAQDGSFHALHYLARLELADSRFNPTEKRLAFIFDADFPEAAFANPELQSRAANDHVVAALKELEFVRSRASEAWHFLVRDSEQLQSALSSSRDADIIYVVAHGAPGKLFLGKQELSDLLKGVELDDSKSTPEKVVVFVSCLYGLDASECADKEPWVVNGIRVGGLNSTAAVAASHNNLAFVYFGDHDELTLALLADGFVRRIVRASEQTWISSIGLLQWDLWQQHWQRWTTKPKEEIPGFRIHDAKSGREDFYSVVESQQMRGTLMTSSVGVLKAADLPQTEHERAEKLENWVEFVLAVVKLYEEKGEALFGPAHLP